MSSVTLKRLARLFRAMDPEAPSREEIKRLVSHSVVCIFEQTEQWPALLARMVSWDPTGRHAPVIRAVMREAVVQVERGYWTDEKAGDFRRTVLDLVVEHADLRGTLEGAALKRFLRALQGGRSPSLSQAMHRRLAGVLRHINATGVMRCAIPIQESKPVRPTAAPKSAPAFAAIEPSFRFLDWAWARGVVLDSKEEDGMGAVERYLLMMFYTLVETGYGYPVAVHILARLRRGDLTEPRLSTPVHLYESSVNTHQTRLTSAWQLLAHGLSHHLKVDRSGSRDDWVWFPSEGRSLVGAALDRADGRALVYRGRAREMRRCLDKLHLRLISLYRRSEQPGCYPPNRLSQFASALRYRALFRGQMPVALFHQLNSLPLPIEAAHHGLYRFLDDKGFDTENPNLGVNKLFTQCRRHSAMVPPGSLGCELQPLHAAREEEEDGDWSARAVNLMSQYLTELNAFLGTNETRKIIRNDHSDWLKQLTEQFVERALEFSEPSSALVVGLWWLEMKMLRREINVGTAIEYGKKIITNGLLHYPASSDLLDWDDEDVELIRRQFVFVPGLADNTRLDRGHRMNDLLRFAKTNGLLRNVQKIKALRDTGQAVQLYRNRILGLHEFDQLIARIGSGCRDAQIVSCVSILMFYGGLRSGEVLHLSLNDVYLCRNECVVYVRGGKTPAARRAIPIGLLAPQKHLEVLRGYDQRRRREMRDSGQSLGRIAYFSAEGRGDAFTYGDLIQPVTAILRRHLGDFIDPHGLRHNFCTWTYLRWYVARYPEVLPTLLESRHYVFHEADRARFNLIFQHTGTKALPADDETQLIHLKKMLGHADLGTSFRFYLHAFGVMHQHQMQRLETFYEPRGLSGEMIALLVPGMASSRSRAKLRGANTPREIVGFLNGA